MNKNISNESLIIIPCCKKKYKGGKTAPNAYIDPLSTMVPTIEYEAILAARRPFDNLLENTNEFIPAIERYSGFLYSAIPNIAKCVKTKSNIDGKPRLLILSAVYGPLHPESLINNYDLVMPKSRKNIWFKAFPRFLKSFVKNQKVRNIHIYVGQKTGYFHVLSNAIDPLLQSRSIDYAVQVNVVNGGSSLTPRNHGIQLANDLGCPTQIELSRTIDHCEL